MTLYEKIQAVKNDLVIAKPKKTGVKKSGTSKDGKQTAGFTYFELDDFLPLIVQSCHKHKLCTLVNFSKASARLRLIDAENTDEETEITVPMHEITIPGSNQLQAFGGASTYVRRYLYMTAFDIAENDIVNQADHEEKTYYCDDCGAELKPQRKNGVLYTSEQVYNTLIDTSEDNTARCAKCRKNREVVKQDEPKEPNQVNFETLE